MPLDPAARVLLDRIAEAGRPKTWQSTPAEARAGWEALAAIAGHGDELFREDDVVAVGPAGDIPVRIYRPSDDAVLPVLVWIHGGGFVIGSIKSYDAVCRMLAARSGCAVASVEYRLAPEHHFPAAVEDAVAATEWLVEHAAALGLDGSRVAVGGDSAGGNLASVLALTARDHGSPQLAFQLLVYPGSDLSLETPSIDEYGSGHFLERETIEWFHDHYLDGDRSRAEDWRASPLRAASVDGLPPALIITGEYDPIRDWGEKYAARLEEAGVPVKLHRYDGMIHGFLSMPTILPAGLVAIDECAAAIREALRG